MLHRARYSALIALGMCAFSIGLCRAEVPATNSQGAGEKSNSQPATKPTLFIVGDSTVKNRGQGWGEHVGKLFDSEKIKVDNRAIAGRSSRTFINEGRWDQILAVAKPSDFVLIQMGHNDGGAVDDAKARGSLKGIGEETREIDNPATSKHEVVHTYGWYLRKYVEDAKSKGMIAIICSPVPHRPKEAVEAGTIEKSNFVGWSEEVAKQEGVPFVNLNRIIRQHYVGMTPDEIKTKYFTPADDTHTSPEGAQVNAACVVEGLKSLTDCPLTAALMKTGDSSKTTATGKNSN